MILLNGEIGPSTSCELPLVMSKLLVTITYVDLYGIKIVSIKVKLHMTLNLGNSSLLFIEHNSCLFKNL